MHTNLISPVKIGAWELPNRIIMAPLTRCRASEGGVPNALMAEYYAQRATAGLIISEATAVMPMGVGYPGTPGIWSDEQIEGWKFVTDAVHNAGGRIVMQLWHVGRISDPIYLDGKSPVAPSAIAPKGHVRLLRPEKPFVTPRALELDEIPEIIEAYRQGAANAKEAGFDGVELHGANGYLLDQFLQDSSNKRTDEYGGSVENRARLMIEAVDAAISVWGADRVGLHIAPRCDTHDMGDSDPFEIFSYVAHRMGERKIAFIFAREGRGAPYLGPMLKRAFGGIYIANQAIDFEMGERMIVRSEADAIAWGKLYIANPDLVRRCEVGGNLNEPLEQAFYHGGSDGYTDYRFMVE